MSEGNSSTAPATSSCSSSAHSPSSCSSRPAAPPPTAPPPPLTIRIGGAAKTQRVMMQIQKQQSAPANFLVSSSGATKRAASGNAITKMFPVASDDHSTVVATPDPPRMMFSMPSGYSSSSSPPIPTARRAPSLSAGPSSFGRSHHQHHFNRTHHQQHRHLQPQRGDSVDDDTTPLLVVDGDGGYRDDSLEEIAIGGEDDGSDAAAARESGGSLQSAPKNVGVEERRAKREDYSESVSIGGGESVESTSTDIQTRTSEFLAALERCGTVRECICEFVNFAALYFKFAVATYVNDRGTPDHADDVCDVIGANVPVNGNANQIYELLLDCVCANIRKKNSIFSSGSGWKPTERVVTINKDSFLLFQLKDANVAVVVARESNDTVSVFGVPPRTSNGERRESAATANAQIPSSAAYAMAVGYLMTARGAMHKRIMQLRGFAVPSNDDVGSGMKSVTGQDGLSPRTEEEGTASTVVSTGGAAERDKRCVIM